MSKRAIVRTDAVVLHSFDYGETSQIVTLFTREKGKVSVIAKGARRTKSRFGATLQPMSYIETVFYYKPTRTLQVLTETSHVESVHRIRRDLERITVGLRIVELVDGLMEDEDAQPQVFNLVVQSLRRLNAAEARIQNLWPFVQLRMATILGVAPAIRREDVEAVTGDVGIISLSDGGVYPVDAERAEARRASRQALRAYAVFARASLDAAMQMSLRDGVRTEVEDLVRAFMQHHFETAYPDRSREVMAQLLASKGQ